ncbi:MAG: hypothetical protein WCO63_15075 [Bacteroidota bacterium]
MIIYIVITIVSGVGQNHAGEPKSPPSLSFPGLQSGPALAMYYNPASLALLENASFACNFQNHFATKELNDLGFSFQKGKKNDGYCIVYEKKGPVFYCRQDLSFGYGRQLGPNIQCGIKLKYRHLSVPDENYKASAMSFDLGVQSAIGKKIRFSALLKDPIAYEFRQQKLTPASVEMGVLWQPDPEWVLLLEIHKISSFRPCLMLGACIRPGSSTTAWIKFYSNPWQTEVGWGLQLKKCQIYSYANYHTVLGLSPGLILCRFF